MLESNKEKVSIVLPVYNGGKYVAAAIDSVLSQSYAEWELLVVDDGSIDATASICDDYAVKDYRIKVFHQSNGGVNTARAKGIDNSTGEYLMFLDADDELTPEALDYLTSHITPEVDLLVCEKCNAIIGKEEYIKALWEGNIRPALWSKMFRTSLYKKIDYKIDRHLAMGEDLLLNSMYALSINQVRVLPNTVYLVNYDNEASVTKTFKHNWEYEKFYFNKVNELFLSKLKQSDGYEQAELLINKSWLNAMKYSIFDGGGINYNDAEFKTVESFFKDKKDQLGPSEKLLFAVKNPWLYRMILKAYMSLNGARN